MVVIRILKQTFPDVHVELLDPGTGIVAILLKKFSLSLGASFFNCYFLVIHVP